MVGDIALDHLFVQADGGDEIPHAPDAAVEIHLADEFEFLLEDLAGFGFQSLHDGGNGRVRGYFDLEVNMVIIGIKGGNEERGIFLRGFVEIFS